LSPVRNEHNVTSLLEAETAARALAETRAARIQMNGIHALAIQESTVRTKPAFGAVVAVCITALWLKAGRDLLGPVGEFLGVAVVIMLLSA
jgi:hypothetical protein